MELPPLMGSATRWMGFILDVTRGVSVAIPIGRAHLFSPLLVSYGFKLRGRRMCETSSFGRGAVQKSCNRETVLAPWQA